ncbi:MAG: UDP-N-acetylmuramate dehydrogenase [Candidatus Sungbacteria bacterium]|nr:UDP-N-acetylmuramate dehydrogenase [Candidatus Sungbacteria bacterium]
MKIQENISLAPYTMYKIGGPARFYIETKSTDELVEAVRFAKEKNLSFFLLGAGSNTLVADRGFNGVIIHPSGGTVNVNTEQGELTADADVMMARAAGEAARAGLGGFSWAVGVPGTIGGSVRGNAGCFGGEMKDVVHAVRFYHTDAGAIKEIDRAACAFAYRDSVFKHRPAWIITSVILKLLSAQSHEIQEAMRRITAERSAKQDIGTKSCGCIFKNPSWEMAAYPKEKMLERYPELLPFVERPHIPASFLIDQTGLKGKKIGRIFVSPRHGNFFVNEGGGTADEVMMLVSLVKDAVRRRYGIVLQEEIQLVGF